VDPLLAIALAVGAYVAWKSNALAPLGLPAPVDESSLPSSSMPGEYPGGTPTLQLTGGGTSAPLAGANTGTLAITAGVSVGTAAVSTPASFAAMGLSGAAAGAALAGIGAVVAIGAALWQAHEQRLRQAKDENSAMNLGVKGIDADFAVINRAYNSRQLSPSDAINLLQQAWAHYWALVTPHIQPGRNGCQGGASCPPWPASGNGCSGSIGAACCVGCYSLMGADDFKSAEALGPDNAIGGQGYYIGVKGAMNVIAHGGGVSLMQKVYASKYGGTTRNAYVLRWQQVSAG
jgi:hypothetical protein